MQNIFDENYWRDQLQKPDWYITLGNEVEYILASDPKNDADKAYKDKAFKLIAEMLDKNQIHLATQGPDFDKYRKPIDTIVIHHTGSPVKNLNMLSTIGLVRQYAMDYLHHKTFGYDLYGKAIWSNHFNKDKQVFYAYHWLVSESGIAERLLEDSYIGRQAGNWNINTRSVGIAISGNYELKSPLTSQIDGLLSLIEENYSYVRKDWILFHSEITNTVCPGSELRRVVKF